MAMRIYDICKEEMDSNRDTKEDLIDMDIEYQMNLIGVNESYTKACVNQTKSSLILRQS